MSTGIEALDNFIQTIKRDQQSIAASEKHLRDRDSEFLKSIVDFCVKLQHEIAQITREELIIFVPPVTIDPIRHEVFLSIDFKQGEQNYSQFQPFSVELKLDGHHVVVCGKQLGPWETEKVLPVICKYVAERIKGNGRRWADFGLENDPTKLMARRQRERG